jgi:hypothetical protein
MNNVFLRFVSPYLSSYSFLKNMMARVLIEKIMNSVLWLRVW